MESEKYYKDIFESLKIEGSLPPYMRDKEWEEVKKQFIKEQKELEDILSINIDLEDEYDNW